MICSVPNFRTSEALLVSIASFFLPHRQLSSSPHLDDLVILCLSSPLLASYPRLFPFTKQQSLSFRIDPTFLVPIPSADQHRARASCIAWSFSSALSVSGIGTPNPSLYFIFYF